MQSPVAHFHELTRALEIGGTIPSDVAAWLHDGLVTLAAGDAPTLDNALGIRGPGIRRPASIYAREQRDERLRLAYGLTTGPSDTERARQLVIRIDRFHAITWPRVRNYAEPPSRLTDTQKQLFFAFKTGVKIPRSAKQIRSIGKSNPLF